MLTKILLSLSFFSILSLSCLSANPPSGYAIVSSVDKSNKYHMTLAYVKTPDMAKVKEVEKLISTFIAKNYPITHNHCHLNWNSDLSKRIMWGPNSLAMGGDVEKFKSDLHIHLKANNQIGKYIGKYRIAHVDVAGNKNAPLYKQIRVDQFYLIKVK